jgi:hypothetical protein
MGNSTIERRLGDGHALDLSREQSGVIEDPACETCGAELEPVPSFGWICLSAHGDQPSAVDGGRAG